MGSRNTPSHFMPLKPYERFGPMQALPKDSEAEKRGKVAFSNNVFLFLVPQILLLVVLMCMSLSLASFVSLTGPGELWRNL